MDYSPRAPFRLTEYELHDWYEHNARNDRAVATAALVQVWGRPVRARRLRRICRQFHCAWHNYRHLLRPLAAYAPPGARDHDRESCEGSPASLVPAGDAAPVLSSLMPAGASSVPAGAREGRDLRGKLCKVLDQPCRECHWWRSGRCICPGVVTGTGSKCPQFRAGAYQLHGYGPRFTGGRGSRPWTAFQPVEVRL